MGPNNLAVVFGPSLLKSRTSRSSEPMMMLADAPKANAIVEALIKLRAAGKLALTAGLAPTAGEKEQRSVHSEAGAIMQVLNIIPQLLNIRSPSCLTYGPPAA